MLVSRSHRGLRILANLLEVSAHRPPRGLGVAPDDGVENAFVMILTARGTAGHEKYALALLAQEIDHRIQQGGHEGILRRLGEGEVQVQVRLDKSLGVVQRVIHRVHRLVHRREVLLRGVLGGAGGDLRFQNLAHLHQVAPGFRPADFDHQTERVAHGARRPVDDERPAPGLDLDEPLFTQRLDRLANGRATHAELLGQLTLGRQLIAHLRLPRQNSPLDLFDDLFVEPARMNRLIHVGIPPTNLQYGNWYDVWTTIPHGARSCQGGLVNSEWIRIIGDLRSEYRFLAPQLAAAGYRVITVDVRGHGETSARWPDYSVAGIGADLRALIRHLNAGPATIVGASMAAGAAVWRAAEAPDLVAGLVLLGPAVRGDVSRPMQLLFSALFARPWGPAAWHRFYGTLYPTRKPADFPQYSAAVRANLKEQGRMEALIEMINASKKASEERVSRVSAPTLAIMGSKDPDFKDPEAEAKWVAEQVRGKYVMVDGAGHHPHAEMPEITGPLVVSFLKELRGTRELARAA